MINPTNTDWYNEPYKHYFALFTSEIMPVLEALRFHNLEKDTLLSNRDLAAYVATMILSILDENNMLDEWPEKDFERIGVDKIIQPYLDSI